MRITFILSVIIIVGCTEKNATSAQAFDSIFDSVFRADEPGGAVLIAKDGKIVYEKGFGVEDIKTKKAIDSKTLFNVGSITKTFVAFGILQLAKENKLSLDDDIYKSLQHELELGPVSEEISEINSNEGKLNFIIIN